ncbi:MAG TPA: hypothetical protein VND01_00385 [Candidatus Acidoferrales bacterium]|nr:hypothetical protein [Candidatus Acidoferrales bacterium]
MKPRSWARRSRESALELARSFEASGLSRGEFAGRAGISTRTLDHYRRRARAQARPGLVEVEVTAPMAWGRGSGLALVLANGRRIEVGAGFGAEDLARLLAVAEGRP